MNADTLISMVLNEGKIRHLVIPEYGEGKTFNTDYADPRLTKRAQQLNQQPSQDREYGTGLSPNRHLNAVVRHILPSLGSMLRHEINSTTGASGVRGPGYSQLNPELADDSIHQVRLNPHQSEIFKEYDRHLTDLATHLKKKIENREKNNIEHGGHLPDDFFDYDDGTLDNIVNDQRHDQIDHRGTGLDVSILGEVIASFVSPKSETSLDFLHKNDHHLDDYSIDQLKARLDNHYRNIRRPLDLDRRHHDRILSASRKISIPAGRFQGKRQAGRKRVVRPIQRTYDDLRPTATRQAGRMRRLINLKDAKRSKGSQP